MIALAAVSIPAAGAEKPKAQASIEANPGLSPAFGFKRHDYVVRCDSNPVKFRVAVPAGWTARVGALPRRGSSSTSTRQMSSGSRVTLRLRTADRKSRESVYHVRCLPDDFPDYTFRRLNPGGPRLFVMQFANQYAAIINRDGAPVWWYQADGVADNARIMPDGNIAWAPVARFDFQQGEYEIRNLRGRLLKTINTANGKLADVHELLQLKNGNYLTGTFSKRTGVDATEFGGAADASVTDAEIQELRPDGSLAWSWNSGDHISLAETGRWWDMILPLDQPYDTVHWNSVERNGNTLLMSFRHLDATYKIDRATGDILWKLGGTPIPESLKVVNGPDGQTFGGQHDARQNPDGTISIFNNNTLLETPAAAVRYRVNEERGTAKLVSSISDPKAPWSFCCGSYNVLPSGDSLIGWGGVTKLPGNPFVTGSTFNGVTGAYDPDGDPLFRLKTPGAISYRANSVETADPSVKKLRNAMDWMKKHP